MKSKFLTLAFSLLATHQVLRFILSLVNKGTDEEVLQRRYEKDASAVNRESFEKKFAVTQFSGFTSKDERTQRKANLYTTCMTSNLPNSLDQLSPKQRTVFLKHVVVSDKYKFLYCYTPKVACSNWKRVVMLLNGLSEDSKAKLAAEHPHGLKYLAEFSEKEIEHKMKHYYKFMFVRNPLERLLSAYRNKFGEIESIMKSYGVKIKKKYGNITGEQEEYDGKIPGDDVTFEEFVRFLIDGGPPETMNEHWAPMMDLCQPCVIDYDVIGSYDHLYEDSEAILRQIGAPKEIHFPARQSFYSPTTFATTAYFYSLVGQDYLKELFSKYSQDFKLFSYPFPKIYYSATNNHL